MSLNLRKGKIIEEDGKQYYVLPYFGLKFEIKGDLKEISKVLENKNTKVPQKRKPKKDK